MIKAEVSDNIFGDSVNSSIFKRSRSKQNRDGAANNEHEDSLQRTLIEEVRSRESYDDPITDITSTYIGQCSPRKPNERYLCDPNLPIDLDRKQW